MVNTEQLGDGSLGLEVGEELKVELSSVAKCGMGPDSIDRYPEKLCAVLFEL
jgi:hypothetical protein